MATFALLTRVSPPFAIHNDGIRDQLFVRDCTELGRCHMIGAGTSVPGRLTIFQGAVWLDLLTAVRVLGGDTGSQVAVVLALNALAAGLTFIVVWRWLHPTLAVPAGFLVGALTQEQASLLVNGSAPPLFNAITVAAMLCYGLSHRVRFLIVAAFAAGLAVNVHASAITLVFPLLLIVALGPIPHRALLWAGTLFAAVYLVTSGTALRANVIALAGRPLLVLLLAPAGLVLAAMPKLGPAFRALSARARALAIGCIIILPFYCAVLWLAVVENRSYEQRYFHPIAVPVAVVLAALLCLPFHILGKRHDRWRWVPSLAAVCVLALQIVLAPAAPPPYVRRAWTVNDATSIGREAAKIGWDFEALAFHLQAKGCGDLLMGIAVEGPRLAGEPPADDLQLQVVTTSHVAPTANEHVVIPLEQGRTALMRTLHSWIQPRGIMACRRSSADRRSESCTRLPVDNAGRWAPIESDAIWGEVAHSPGERSLESRMVFMYEPANTFGPHVMRYEIPVRPVAGQSRAMRLADPGPEGCRWEFTSADGLRIRDALPATQVHLDAESGDPGVLTVEKPFGTPECPSESAHPYPPCIFETEPGDAFERLLAGDG